MSPGEPTVEPIRREEAPIVGIDLGTTHSLIAVVQAGRPVLIPNALGAVLTPSAVHLKGGEVVLGEAARQLTALHPERGALAFKRDMGTDRTYRLARRSFTPPDLSALVLAGLREDAEEWLGQPVSRAVVTVPAYFDDLQRQATLDAGKIAGLEVVRLLNEPTAAAMAFGLHQLSRELKAVVLDLGGGTFDITVLEILEGVIEVLSSAGDSRLGGEDFTDRVAELLAARIEEATGARPAPDAASRARLRAAAESAKKRLSREETCTVALTDLPLADGRMESLDLELERAVVEEAWSGLLGRMRRPVLRALSDAGLEVSEVDEVLLVGGATRMPVVRRFAAELFGRSPNQHVAPDEVVAQGAALQAALHQGDRALEDLIVTDVAPFSLGVDSSEELGGRWIDGLFTPILERGTVIPASRSKTFSTVSPFQESLLIQVFQGEHSLCRDNRKIGELQITDLPPAHSGPGHLVEVRFTYDLNGLLEVEARFPGLDRQEVVVLENEPGRLSPKQIEAARRAMEKLKFHPRDSLPNTTALARAEAQYVELRGEARDRLGHAMNRLRAALEGSDDTEVHRAAREHLLAELDALR